MGSAYVDSSSNELIDENTEEINGVKIYLKKLIINNNTLKEMRDDFNNNTTGKISDTKLRGMLESKYKIMLSNEDFKSMFAKVDVKKEGTVTFLQFVTYLATESALKRKRNERNAEGTSLKLMPKLLPSKPIKDELKRHKLKAIVFNPLKGCDDYGEYLTTSEMGDVLMWTPELDWKATRNHTKSRMKITCILALPDFNVICLFTEDQNLEFYVSTKFELCLSIMNWPSTIRCLAYSQNSKTGSMMAIGDNIGTVQVFKFPVLDKKNPFRGRVGSTSTSQSFTYQDMVNSETNELNLTSINLVRFPKMHPQNVHKLEFCNSGNFLVSISPATNKSIAYCWVGKNSKKRDKPNPVNRYVSSPDRLLCVCSADKGLVVTGGVDQTVRLWNFDECFADGQPKSTRLLGHNTAVQHVFYNQTNCRLYSVAADRVVKIWDVLNSVLCLLTFDKAATMTKAAGLQYVPAQFNQFEQKIVMAVGNEFVTIKCADTDSENSVVISDTHDEAVLKTMYCRPFHVLISVSTLDSAIAVWNLFTGQLIHKWTMAHNKKVYGEMMPVEITAANFDPSGGLLITGAINGTVHVWDPNNGTCLNRLQIPSRGRISDIIWMPNKVLVTSWDRKVTEFNEPLLVSSGKVWLTSHDGAVLSACEKLPSLFVTTSMAGEIGFWRLETGQLIKKHKARMKPDSSSKHSRSTISMNTSPSSVSFSSGKTQRISIADGANLETKEETYRRLNIKYTPKEHYAAVASMFLRARPEADRIGTLLISTRNGVVQLWCTFKVPKYVTQFTAIHLNDDYVTSMASDLKNNYLFTSFDSGFVKTWHIANFGKPHTIVQPVSMPRLRLQFPFLLESLFIGRAERAAAKNPSGPLLVSSYRAHLKCVRHIEYVDGHELLVTSSADKNIRIWTIAGHYVGTLGTRWPSIPRTGVVNMTQFTIPSDIRREASFTTIKVLSDGVNSALRSPELWTKLVESREQRKLEGKMDNIILYGTQCPKNPLHNLDFMENKKKVPTEPTKIKINGPEIAIYKYLPISDLAVIPKFEVLNKSEKISKRKKGVSFGNKPPGKIIS